MSISQTSSNSNWNLSRLGLDFKNPRWWIEVICVAFAYFAMSWMTSIVISKVSVPSPVWPGAGTNVGLLLAWGRSRWLGVFLGAFYFNVNRAKHLSTHLVIASIGSTIGTLIVVSLILKFTHTKYPFNRYSF